MMQETLFLLLPVAAFSGWLLARLQKPARKEKKAACAYEPAYYKGLNFLLNEQPDKAIDVFVNLLEVDSETVETHLALGSLFRKRGEVDRAIRIHQNLIARPSLDPEQRANALLELGLDYMNAGLFDRAENLFTELYENGRLQKKALLNLKEIYQQEKVWDRCLKVVRQLENLSSDDYSEETAHYYCELAEQAQKAGEMKQAIELIRKARQSAPDAIRPLMMEASLAVSREDYRKALKIYQDIIDIDDAFVSEVLQGLMTCLKQTTSAAELRRFLDSLFSKTADSRVLEELVLLISQSEGSRQAAVYLAAQMSEKPSLKGMKLIGSLQIENPVLEQPEILSLLDKTISTELSERAAFTCRRCGYHAKTLHWQCPGCRSWGTIRPSHDKGTQPI